jgi:outer membrane protein OmpA-like peptidoglycan-associated protein
MQVLKIQNCLILTLLLFLSGTLSAQDVKGSKDHPLFNRMPGYRITNFKEREFDVYKDFKDKKGNKISVEGKYYYYNYGHIKGTEQPSGPQILRNYINAVKKAGGEVVLEDGCCYVFLRLSESNQTTWVKVKSYSDAGSYQVWIIEEAKMEQDIVADPKTMGNDIERTGRVAIYGIFFDTDSYKIKQESDPTLKAIAELLKTKSGLNVYIVGHTDMTGDLDHNMKLSEERAKAVVNALVKDYGISAKRLIGKGVGPLSPASTNKTDEGKQLNRRVELVER